jgi:hypothetical protein
MGQIITNRVDFSVITTYPPVDCYVLGLDTADNKLKKLDHNGVLTIIEASTTVVNSPYWVKVNKTYQDFSIADTSNTIELTTLPAKTVFHDIYYLQTIPFDQSTPGANMTNAYLGSGSATVYTFPFDIGVTCIAGSFSVTDTIETFSDNGAGVLTSNLGGTGTINYTTGVGSVTFNTAPLTGQAITASWQTTVSGGGMIFDFGTGAKKIFSLNSVDILAYLTPPLVPGTLSIGQIQILEKELSNY